MAFKCSLCEKVLSRNANLKIHMRTHTGERPFRCHTCTKAFIDASGLKQHKRTHTGERPFKCHKCTKAFKDAKHLKRHELTHTGERPFKCQQCPKAFAQSGNLKQHECTHTGERPFKCHQCPKAFAQFSKLKRHEPTHIEERLYKCDNCNKTFTRADNLKRHEFTHTTENNSTSLNNNEIKSPFKNSLQEEFPQPNISDRNLNKIIDGKNQYSYQVYQNKFPMAHHREIHQRTNTIEAHDLKYNQCKYTEFPQPNIPTINQSTNDDANRNPYQVYHNKFPMNNQMSYRREIHSEEEANHSNQSSSNIQSSRAIHPEQHSFQDEITNQNVANYTNLSTQFNAMDKTIFPHQFISRNIQPTISHLDINVQTQGGKNIQTLNERQDTNLFSFNVENEQNLHMSMTNAEISILNRSLEHRHQSESFPAGNIKENSSLSNPAEEKQNSYDTISELPLEFDMFRKVCNTHDSQHQQSVTTEEPFPDQDTRSKLDSTDMNSQIQNVLLEGNTHYQHCPIPSSQKQEILSTTSGLETNVPIDANVLEAIPWIEQSVFFGNIKQITKTTR